MANPSCHYCDRPAEAECATCGRLYCAEHGDEVCLRCMQPESATPAPLMYRGSLLALVVASLLAIFLVLSPPESESRTGTIRVMATPTPGQPTATPTPVGGATPAPAVTTPAASPSPAQTAAATPTAANGARTHTVVSGDTLSTIAQEYGTTVEAIVSLNDGIGEDTPLQIGQTLRIPAAQ
jgi:hypothetical protein